MDIFGCIPGYSLHKCVCFGSSNTYFLLLFFTVPQLKSQNAILLWFWLITHFLCYFAKLAACKSSRFSQ